MQPKRIFTLEVPCCTHDAETSEKQRNVEAISTALWRYSHMQVFQQLRVRPPSALLIGSQHQCHANSTHSSRALCASYSASLNSCFGTFTLGAKVSTHPTSILRFSHPPIASRVLRYICNGPGCPSFELSTGSMMARTSRPCRRWLTAASEAAWAPRYAESTQTCNPTALSRCAVFKHRTTSPILTGTDACLSPSRWGPPSKLMRISA